jgi:hypothetical protein
MTTPPSLLAHLTGLAEASAPPLPPAPENIMAAVASLPAESQDTVLAGMGFSRPVVPAPAPEPIVDTSAELPTVWPEPAAEKPAKRGRPPKATTTPSTFTAELLIACASGGLGTDDYDAYCTRAKEAGLL